MMLNRGRGVSGTLHVLTPAIFVHGTFDAIAFILSPDTLHVYVREASDREVRLLCVLSQLFVLLCGFARVESLYKKLNIWALSDAVHATGEKMEPPLVSMV